MHFFHIEVATVTDILQKFCESEKSPSRIVVGVIYEERLDEKDFVAKLKISAFAHPYYEKLKKKLCVFEYILLFGYWKKFESFNINQHIEIIDSNLNSMEDLYSNIADKLDGISAFTYFLNLTECKNYSFINIYLRFQNGNGCMF